MQVKTASFRNCAICGYSEVAVLGELKYRFFDDYVLSNKFNVVACTKCFFSYYDTESSYESFIPYYSQNAYYLPNTPGSGSSPGCNSPRPCPGQDQDWLTGYKKSLKGSPSKTGRGPGIETGP